MFKSTRRGWIWRSKIFDHGYIVFIDSLTKSETKIKGQLPKLQIQKKILDLFTTADERVWVVERFARHHPGRSFLWVDHHAVGRRIFGHQIWTKVGDIHWNHVTYVAYSLESIGGRSRGLFADSLPDLERSVWGKFSFHLDIIDRFRWEGHTKISHGFSKKMDKL